VRGASSVTLLGGRSLHGDALMRAPRPDLGHARLVRPLDPHGRLANLVTFSLC